MSCLKKTRLNVGFLKKLPTNECCWKTYTFYIEFKANTFFHLPGLLHKLFIRSSRQRQDNVYLPVVYIYPKYKKHVYIDIQLCPC